MTPESRARPSGSAVACLGVLLLAAATLLQLAGRSGPGRSVSALLVDVSASVTRTRPDHAAWLARELRRELAGDEDEGGGGHREALLVAYAGRARRLAADLVGDGSAGGEELAAAALAAAQGVLASELAAALDVAAGDPDLARVVVLGDGTWTGADPAERLAALAAAGVRVELRSVPPPELPDARLANWGVPARLPAGVAGIASASGVLAPGSRHAETAAALELEVAIVRLEGAADAAPRALRAPLSPADSAGAWRTTVALPALPEGVYRVDARLLGAGLDPVPENDQRSAILRVGSARRVAVLAAARDEVRASAWLRGVPGLSAAVAAPDRLAELAPRVDVLATWDLDPAELPEAVLASFLERGGTWIAAGGERWARARDVTGGAWSLLPLAPEDGAPEPRTVHLLVDSSGSMAGASYDLAVRSAARLVEVAREADDVVAQRFTDTLGERSVLRSGRSPSNAGDAADALARWLSARRPGGPTDVVAALAQLADRAVAGEEALVFVLSDGRTDAGAEDPAQAARLAAVRSRLAVRGMRLVVVAVGAEADRDALARLAGGPELVRVARDLEELEVLVTREVRERRTVPGHGADPRVVLDGGADETLLAAWSEGAFGAFELAVRCDLGPGATPLLRTTTTGDAGAPLVALQHRGRGVAVAVAALPGVGWAPGWAGAAGWSALALAGGGADESDPPRLLDGLLSLPGEGLPPVVEARVEDGAGGSATARLTTPTGPAGDRRVGRLPAGGLSPSAGRANSPWIVRLLDPATGRELGVQQLVLPAPREFEGSRLRLPREAVDAGGSPAPESPGGRGHPAVPFLILLGLGALVLSAGLRWDRGAVPAADRQGLRASGR